MRKLFIGIFAALAVIFLGATPAFAAATVWSPTESKQGSYYIEDSVPQDAKNTIESALELAEVSSDSSRHLYVAKLPEGTNVQTAAREVAKTWGLNKDEQSLVFYDVTSGGTFIWPATEANVSLAATVNGASSVDQFSTQIPSIFDGFSGIQAVDATDGEDGSSSFLWIIVLIIGVPMVILIVCLFMEALLY